MERPFTQQIRWAGTHLVLVWLTAVLVTLRLTGSLQPVGPLISWGLGLVCLGILLAAQAAEWLDQIERFLSLLLALTSLMAVAEWSGPWSVMELAVLLGLFAVASAVLETIQFGATGRLSAALCEKSSWPGQSHGRGSGQASSTGIATTSATGARPAGDAPAGLPPHDRRDSVATTELLAVAPAVILTDDREGARSEGSRDLSAESLADPGVVDQGGGLETHSPQHELRAGELARDSGALRAIIPGTFSQAEPLDDVVMTGSGPMPDEHARQWTTRCEADGEDRVEGWCRLDFETGQKIAVRIEVRRSGTLTAETVTVGYSAAAESRAADAA